jgi:hypothetical protein
MGNVLTSRREDQQGFGQRHDRFVRGHGEKDLTDRFRTSSPTRFSGLKHAVPCLSQDLREVANLGAFPTAFDSFKRDKQATRLLCLCPHQLASSSVKKTGGMVFQVLENSNKRLARLS